GPVAPSFFRWDEHIGTSRESLLTTSSGSATRPSCTHGPHTNRSRAGYAYSERAPRWCSTTVPHIAIAPITPAPLEKTPDAARWLTESAAYSPQRQDVPGAAWPREHAARMDRAAGHASFRVIATRVSSPR